MEAVNLIGSPKTPTVSHYDDWDTSHVAEMVFDACSHGSGVVKSAEIISYVRDNWVHKENDLKQADDQLRRLLACLDPGASNEGLQFQEFVEKFTLWVESEHGRDAYSRSPKIETYENECDDNGTIESSTTESLLSWDYPPLNGYDHISLKKENQVLKEQISSAEVYNSDLVDEVRELQLKLKNISETKSDLETEVDEQNSEITSLKTEISKWRESAELYKTTLQKLEYRVKRIALAQNESDDSSGRYLPTELVRGPGIRIVCAQREVSNSDGYINRETHDSEILNCKKTISELKEHVAFLKKENDILESQVNELTTEHHIRLNGDGLSLQAELREEEPYNTDLDDFTQEQFVTEEQMEKMLGDEGEGAALLHSFVAPQSLDEFSNLITSIARQLNRVLRSLPSTTSSLLVPKAERQLFTDTLHQMTTSKHLSEIKIAQLVDLFRRLKAKHRKLGAEHVCLKSDYEKLLSEYQDMKSEIVSITRTNAQLRNEVVTVYESAELTPPPTPQVDMQRREEQLFKQEIDDLKKKLKGAEKANLTLTLAIEEQTRQRNALQRNIDELQSELNSSINTISRIEYENKTLTRDNEKLAETYTRQRGDLDELRKEWVAEMDRCTTIETGYNSLNQTIVEQLRGFLTLLKPSISFCSFDPALCLPLEEWTSFLNREFLEATKVVEEIRLNSGQGSVPEPHASIIKKSTEVQTEPITDGTMKGNLARAACFEENRSYSDNSQFQVSNGGVKTASTSAAKASTSTLGAGAGAAAGGAEDSYNQQDAEDISAEFQFTTDVAALSKRSVEGEFQAIILSFENDTFTLQKRLTMHDRAFQKASNSFKSEVEEVQELLRVLKSNHLPEDKREQVEHVTRTLSLLPETMETLTNSSLATGKCQQEEKNIRHFEIMAAHNFHTKKSLQAALALCNQNADIGMPKKDVDRAAVRKKTLAVAAAMRKDEEKQKQMQASEHSSVFSSFAGVVKNLMVKTPAEPDLANRRATEMMQRMKTVETLGADKEALYKEGYRGGLSSGLHDTFDNIKKEQRSCDESVDNLNKRASKLEREVAFYKKHSNHLFYGGAATPAATLRTIFCTIFINLFVLFLLLITVPLPEHSGYTLGTGYISLQEFITSQFLNVPDRDRPLL